MSVSARAAISIGRAVARKIMAKRLLGSHVLSCRNYWNAVFLCIQLLKAFEAITDPLAVELWKEYTS